MKKETIAIILILIILGLGVFVAIKYSSSINIKNIVLGNKNSEDQIQQINSETKNYSAKSPQYNYEVKADYPEFSGLKNIDAQNKINQDVKSSIITIAEQFETDSKTNCDFSNLPGPKPEWICEMSAAFDGFNLVNNKILSVKIVYYQFTGGAHGGATYEFINYNAANGERINWESVFKKDSGYLKIISDYSKNNLGQQLLKPEDSMSDSGWIEEGTAPKNENYNTNVGFTKDGFLVIFQQYQVAAYAAGPQEVTVPYDQLKDAIDSSGALAGIIK